MAGRYSYPMNTQLVSPDGTLLGDLNTNDLMIGASEADSHMETDYLAFLEEGLRRHQSN